jgi:hypothetical protein
MGSTRTLHNLEIMSLKPRNPSARQQINMTKTLTLGYSLAIFSSLGLR